jgi:hypothetical protein
MVLGLATYREVAYLKPRRQKTQADNGQTKATEIEKHLRAASDAINRGLSVIRTLEKDDHAIFSSAVLSSKLIPVCILSCCGRSMRGIRNCSHPRMSHRTSLANCGAKMSRCQRSSRKAILIQSSFPR